jgi:hypothetical protein
VIGIALLLSIRYISLTIPWFIISYNVIHKYFSNWMMQFYCSCIMLVPLSFLSCYKNRVNLCLYTEICDKYVKFCIDYICCNVPHPFKEDFYSN